MLHDASGDAMACLAGCPIRRGHAHYYRKFAPMMHLVMPWRALQLPYSTGSWSRTSPDSQEWKCSLTPGWYAYGFALCACLPVQAGTSKHIEREPQHKPGMSLFSLSLSLSFFLYILILLVNLLRCIRIGETTPQY